MTSEHRKYVSSEQISNYCGVSVAAVEKWISRGHRGPSKDNNKIELEDFILFLKETKFDTKHVYHDHAPKVLVVDNEMSAANSIGDVFSAHGFDVITTSDAIRAGSLINIERPHIVTLDLSLKIFDGRDVLKIINELKLSEKIWVIVISAEREEALQEAVELGADCYLQKPFSESDLNHIINKFFPHTILKAS